MKKYIKKIIEKYFKEHFQNFQEEYQKKMNKIEELNENKIREQQNRLDYWLNQYHPMFCDECKKPFLAHYGGFYTSKNIPVIDKSYKTTKVFCSGKCLDQFSERNDIKS